MDTKKKRIPPNAGKGRGKGNVNKNTKAIKDMIEAALNAVGGQQYLERQAIENPQAFMTLIGKILPKDVNVGGQSDNPLKAEHKVTVAPELTPEQWMQAFGNK